MKILKYIFIFFLFMSSSFAASNHIVYFEPETVNLSGTVIALTFPGVPNYTNIKDGDEEEVGAYLVLDEPVDVRLLPNTHSDTNMPENNIKMLQLAVQNDKDWEKLKNGNRVQISGELFHALCGHHHTLVLLDAKNINVFSKEKIVNNNLSVYLTDDDMRGMAESLQGIVEIKTQSKGLNIAIKSMPQHENSNGGARESL